MCSCKRPYDYGRDAYIITQEYIFARGVTLNSKLPTTIVANPLISNGYHTNALFVNLNQIFPAMR